MPMIDVYAAAGTFPEKHKLAQDLANAVMNGKKLRQSISLIRTQLHLSTNFLRKPSPMRPARATMSGFRC